MKKIIVCMLPVLIGTAHASVSTLEFSGGSGTTAVDQFNGKSGGGWATAWSGSGAASKTISVESDDPLHDGSGNYLSFSATSSANPQSSYIYRSITNDAVSGIDLASAFTVSFSLRVDSLASGSVINIFGDNAGGLTGTGSSNTWNLSASATGGWSGGNGVNNVSSGIALSIDTTYDFSISVDPTGHSFVYTVTDGSSSFTSGSISFRNTGAATGGSYLYFGTQNLNKTLTTTFSLDSISVAAIPEPRTVGMAFGAMGLMAVLVGRRLRRPAVF